MSPYHLPRPLGLVAASLLGLGAPILAALAPAAQDAPPDAAPITTAPAPAGERTSVLLLTNGQLRIHRGELIEEGPNYLLKARAGAVRIPRRTVEHVFGSMHELYLHKKSRMPQGDPDEHMKLAQWCLGQSMTAEAQEQLDAVLALSPDDAFSGDKSLK